MVELKAFWGFFPRALRYRALGLQGFSFKALHVCMCVVGVGS